MMKPTSKTYQYTDFVLPANVISKLDISRLVHEVEWLDSELTTKSVRSKAGIHAHVEPVVSEQLAEFLQQNNFKLLEMTSRERDYLVKQLQQLKDKVPVIHMTFATTADGESLAKLASWVRESLHPQAVIAVGMQPALVAGVYMRTPNRVHDFSLRSKLEGSHDVLVKQLEALRG